MVYLHYWYSLRIRFITTKLNTGRFKVNWNATACDVVILQEHKYIISFIQIEIKVNAFRNIWELEDYFEMELKVRLHT